LTVRALVEAAAQGHKLPHVDLEIEERPDDAATGDPAHRGMPAVPMVRRSPEIIHGLGNILQNAMQFARRKVVVRAEWDRKRLSLTVSDDGPGFPAGVLSRIGEPYISSRAETGKGMGLGIFIAQTLLERTGAEVAFANSRSGGAQVVVTWSPPIFVDRA
jgi:two-component system sensor histidine kinase RegB